MRLLPFPSEVERARAEMFAERADVARATGLRFFSIVCPRPGCTVIADGIGVTDGEAEGKADRELARHLVNAHGHKVSA